MKAIVFNLQSTGTVSVESIEPTPKVDYAARLARLAARRDPDGIELANLTDAHRALQTDTNNLHILSSVAAGLEAIAETIEEVIRAEGISDDIVHRLGLIATELSAVIDVQPVGVYDNEGVATTESLVDTASTAYRAVQGGVKELVSNVSNYYQRYRSVSVTLHAQLQAARTAIHNSRYTGPVKFTPSVAMVGLTDVDGRFEFSAVVDALRRFTLETKWVVGTLAPETANLLDQVGQWVDNLDLSNDATVDSSFTLITDILPPQTPSDWNVIDNSEADRRLLYTNSTPTFGNLGFTATRPIVPPATDADWLQLGLVLSNITYGAQDDLTLAANDAVIELEDASSVLALIDGALELLEYHTVFNLHSGRLVKALNGLINSGERLMERGSAVQDLSESSMAKLLLAVQAPLGLSLRAQSPFRDVLYESIRVLVGVVSLAKSVESAIDLAE